MTRLGINPARGEKSQYRPARVSLAMITFIPHLSGYFEQRLEVLKLCLSSLIKHTSPSYDLIVFDNASCAEVTKYLVSLKESEHIHYLILSSQNIGKIGALRLLCDLAPGEIFAYTDDDIFFYPGWLEAHLKVLQTFPNAGMVSGVPVRNAARHAHRSIDQFALQPPRGFRVEVTRYIPDAWEMDWALSTGRDPQQHLESTNTLLDTLFYREGGKLASETAVAGANHFQFVTPKLLLQKALPSTWSGKLMGEMIELDEAVDYLGYLRLSTANRFVRHMGNALSEAILEEARTLKVHPSANTLKVLTPPSSLRQKHRLIRYVPGLRRLIMFLYKRLFNLLYQ